MSNFVNDQASCSTQTQGMHPYSGGKGHSFLFLAEKWRSHLRGVLTGDEGTYFRM